MYRAGAAIVLEDTAEFEAEARQEVAENLPGVTVQARGTPIVVPGHRPGAVPATSEPGGAVPVTTTGVPSGRMLPCTDDPDLFFAESPADVEYAKDLCRGCLVRVACLAGALERREPWGVWGGELFLRGEIVPRKRPRGRPRKDEVAA
jgi:WhiB family redox-sensing transcriptional regulator